MRVVVFSDKPYWHRFLLEANEAFGHELTFIDPALNGQTVALAAGFPAVCVFVHDQVDGAVLKSLKEEGTELIALRCAGFNNVDLRAAAELGIKVVRVPAYSPHAVAEHAVTLILALNRKIHRAYARVREGNMSLEGLLGVDLHAKTVGILGTGRIGAIVARIMHGFGCRILAYDPFPNDQVGQFAEYVSLEEMAAESDVITLHCPLTPETYHLVNADWLKKVKVGCMLINTSRGALIDTRAAIHSLKTGRLGALGLDVYEEEEDLFFEDLSDQVIQDDVFARLLTFPNVIITAHQGFFTREALEQIATTTLSNIRQFENGAPLINEVRADRGLVRQK
ncbi:MAG: 2-hydroxyacid dehydrogenase [Thermoguttaceae bacterium]